MSDFLDNLRNMALTDDKVEEIKKEIEALKENIFNNFVDRIVRQIKEDIETKVKKGEYAKTATKNVLRSCAYCDTEYSASIDDKLKKKIEAANLEKLLDADDGYYYSKASSYLYSSSFELKLLKIRKENRSGYNGYGSTMYSCDYPHKEIIKKVLDAVESKAANENIKIFKSFFKVKWSYTVEYEYSPDKYEEGAVIISSVDINYSASKVLCCTGESVSINKKLCFDYEIEF